MFCIETAKTIDELYISVMTIRTNFCEGSPVTIFSQKQSVLVNALLSVAELGTEELVLGSEGAGTAAEQGDFFFHVDTNVSYPLL